MPFKSIKNSFNSGELSEYMTGRTDISKYYNGCSKLVNATVLPHGGVVKRSGTKFIARAKQYSAWQATTDYPVGAMVTNSDTYYYCHTAHTSGAAFATTNWTSEGSSVSGSESRVIPFEFSVDDALVLEFGLRYIRFYSSGARVFETAIDIDGATLNGTDPVIISTDGAHSYTTGNTVKFQDVTGTTELNGNEYVITKVDADDFSLDGTDSSDFTAWDDAGTVKRVYEIISPFDSDEIFEIHFTQSADVIFFAHEDHHPQKLSRTSNTSWTMADVGFTGGPFLGENTTAAYLMGFARTGGTARSEYYFPAGATGTLTATGGHTPFLGTANDVGTLWLVKHTRDEDNSTTTFAHDDNSTPTLTTYASGAIKIKGNYTMVVEPVASGDEAILWRKEGNGKWQQYRSFRVDTSFSASEDEDDVLFVMTRSVNTVEGTLTAKSVINYGIVEVTAHSSTTVATVTVIDAVLSNNTNDNAVTTSLWAEGAWSIYRGYPRTLAFFEDRLWWASSTNNPDTLWSSQSGDYEDMSYSNLGLDDEAITAPLKDSEVSQIQWMIARQIMAIGAANKEYKFGAANPDDPVTPSDRKAIPQTSFGSDNIQPVILNDTIFFFQRHSKKLRAMKFDSIAENFVAEDATLLANTIFDSKPTCMAVQRIPDSIIWVVRTDGVIASFTYEPDEEVSGWARHITQNTASPDTPSGYYESVTVIHGSVEDEVWASIRRVVGSTSVRYIERFATRYFDAVDEALMLDSAIIVSSAYDAVDLVLASDTIRCGSGLCNSSLCGGVLA